MVKAIEAAEDADRHHAASGVHLTRAVDATTAIHTICQVFAAILVSRWDIMLIDAQRTIRLKLIKLRLRGRIFGQCTKE